MPPTYAYRDRPLDPTEMERLRLTLSSFRDGSGQVALKRTDASMPGFRDYERTLAAVLGGSTTENKGIFDLEVPTMDNLPFGVSCKMAAFPPPANGCSFWEMSNSAAKFREHLLASSINWATEPMLAGPAIINLVTQWHLEATIGLLDLAGSRYSVLAHNRIWTEFQVLCFPLDLKIADPVADVTWAKEGAALNGYIRDGERRHRLWQLYPNSGGQLKYYPLLWWADWKTDRFTLEMPPTVSPFGKAQEYWPDLWPI